MSFTVKRCPECRKAWEKVGTGKGSTWEYVPHFSNVPLEDEKTCPECDPDVSQEAKRRKPRRHTKYPLRDSTVGEEFFIERDCDTQELFRTRISNIMQYYRKNYDMQFESRTLGTGVLIKRVK